MKAFTADVYAAALKCTKRAVQMAFLGIPATETRTIRGQAAKAWVYEVAPTLLRAKLENAALKENFPTPQELVEYCDRLNNSAPEATPAPVITAEAIAELHAALQDARECLKDATNISPGEAEYIWEKTCGHITAFNPQRRELAALKREAVDWLQKNLPGMAASVRSLERKLSDPAKRADLRAKKSGNHRNNLCPECWEKALRLNIDFGGKASLAWRQLKKRKLLCVPCDGKHIFDIRRAKSYVPHSIRARLTAVAKGVLTAAKSEAAARAAGPYLDLDWSGVNPGDWFVGDDVTWNHVVWTTDSTGKPFLCRPECLYLADLRTGYPIHFILIPAQESGQKASYNNSHIRLLMLQSHDKVGLPNRGYLFENGPWRARGVHDRLAGDKAISWAETETGFKTLENFIEIRHTKPRTPRAKPCEGDFHILQNLMRDLPGFVGFNERAEKTDRMKKLEAEVKTGKVHPSKHFMSMSQFAAAISAKLDEFKAEPQNGKRLNSISPQEGFGTPLFRKLPEEGRYIMASCHELLKVTDRGLMLKGKCYANAKLATYKGDYVWTFYNLECPEVLTVADRKKENFFSVPLLPAPAMTARDTAHGRAQLKTSQGHIDDFNKPAKIIAASIKHPVITNVVRDLDVNEEHREVGREMEQAVTAHRAQQREVSNARKQQEREGERTIRASLAKLASIPTSETL